MCSNFRIGSTISGSGALSHFVRERTNLTKWTLILFCVTFCNCTSVTTVTIRNVTLWTKHLNEIYRYVLTMQKCTSLAQRNISGTLISIDHGGLCFEVHRNENCDDDYIIAKPGVPAHDKLYRWNSNGLRSWIEDGARAISPCRECTAIESSREGQSVNVSLFGEPRFKEPNFQKGKVGVKRYQADECGTRRDLFIKGCKVIPKVLRKVVASLRTDSLFCIELYDDRDCFGDSIQIPSKTPYHLTADLEEWEFSNKSIAVSFCRRKCQILATTQSSVKDLPVNGNKVSIYKGAHVVAISRHGVYGECHNCCGLYRKGAFISPKSLKCVDELVLLIVLVGLAIVLILGSVIFLLIWKSRYQRQKSILSSQCVNVTTEILLTRGDIKDFKYGIGTIDSKHKIDDGETGEPLLQPYAVEYELRKSNVQIYAANILGKGAFGIVFKGKLLNHEYTDEVAVKATGDGSNATGVKMLLSEIKCMIHVGKHSNVVSIIGACTADACYGKVLLIAELCEKGSLETYLRTNFNKITSDPSTTISNNRINMMEKFISWSYQIASGMEHISSKNITHADLATRNVLLSNVLVAKITDFGLSRRIYNYKTYVQFNNNEPLPWRWMALESLNFLKFSTQSDVWAYGVTLWEIFSLGKMPYPGINWTTSFLSELEEGVRLKEPEMAEPIIYELMMKCWLADASRRPSFSQLKDFFKLLSYNNPSTVYTNLD